MKSKNKRGTKGSKWNQEGKCDTSTWPQSVVSNKELTAFE